MEPAGDPRPGDVVLVAYVKHARWISKRIQQISGSLYSHAMIALGNDRFAEARPAPGGNIVLLPNDAALSSAIQPDTMYDLYRGTVEPDPAPLAAVVDEYRARANEPPHRRPSPCGKLSKVPGVIFSDGNLLVLWLFRSCRQGVLKGIAPEGLVNAAAVTLEDGEGRLLCSGFVHRVLDLAGARPAAPPPHEAFIDLSGFPTDEPPALGGSSLVDWLVRRVTAGADVDAQSLRTCSDVMRMIVCHFRHGTPVPKTLHVANFVTPGDLALSPSLRQVGARCRLPNGRDTGWLKPEDAPVLGGLER